MVERIKKYKDLVYSIYSFIKNLKLNKTVINLIRVFITVALFYILFHKLNLLILINNLKNISIYYILIAFFIGVIFVTILLVIRLQVILRFNKIYISFFKLT